MFRIGEFSKLSQVPVKTLRFYDEMGLFSPAEVDRFTGYRYYSAHQLPRINRILALKDLGFSLEQITRMLDENLSVDTLHGMLRMKQHDIEREIDADRARLARVAARLRQIEREGAMSSYDVVLKHVETFRAATLRRTMPTYGDVGQLFGQLYGHLMPQGARPAGPMQAIYHDPEYREHDCDIEAVMPLSGDAQGTDAIQVRDLPGEQMATTIHQGPYDGISSAYSALMTWIEQNGYTVTGPSREVYARGMSDQISPEEYVTEVQFPVAKA